MRLKTLILENFRSYSGRTYIEISDFTAFIGKNDAGKSTIFEALEIFFNNLLVKIDSSDACVFNESKEVRIGCIFTDFEDKIIIDSTTATSLKKEFLLNEDGDLEIYKIFDCSKSSPKDIVFSKCIHPSNPQVSDLLLLKITDLRKKLKEFSIDESQVDLRTSSSIRQAIYEHKRDELNLAEKEIPLNKEDAKSIWDTLKNNLPIYSLFQSDRASRDDDTEVQDPMKLAVTEAIKQVEHELARIVGVIQKSVEDVAERTLSHLKDIDETLANELNPYFSSEPKWNSLFKLSLTGDNSIPVNKRGSGVRRLILLSFFKAEVERKRHKSTVPVIYAIEEPETSQHPNNQLLIIKSLLELSEQEHCQVLVTTHVPALAGEIPLESLRYIIKDSKVVKQVLSKDESMYEQIAQDLGVYPNNTSTPVLLCVEGSNDVSFFKHISRILNQKDPSFIDLNTETQISVLPLGGSTLIEWVKHRYLRNLGVIEIHIYDRDNVPPMEPKYLFQANTVNQRGDGSIAFITNKKELENYIHYDAVKEVLKIDTSYGDFDDVPQLISSLANMSESKVKKWLNDKVVSRMTYEQLCDMDKQGEIEGWFIEIRNRLNFGVLTAEEVAASNEIN